MVSVIRSLAFYLMFYGASILWVLLGFLAVMAGGRGMGAVARAWAGTHRFCAHWLLGIRLRIEGEPTHGAVLYAFRHESFLEAIELPYLLSSPVVFAKEELFRIPGWGRAALYYGLIPVSRDRGASGLRTMLTAARKSSASGRPLVIFPEGTRVPHGQRGRLQSGFAGLYKMLGLPVVPVALNSGPLYHRTWKRKGVITMRFGTPIPPGLPREEVEARVLDAINVLNGEAVQSNTAGA